jgi:hypothetical protein
VGECRELVERRVLRDLDGMARPEVAQEMAVACQKDAVFPIREVDERSVVQRRVVHRVVAQHAKPSGETPEHRVGDEAQRHCGLHLEEAARGALAETKPAARGSDAWRYFRFAFAAA